MNKFLLLGLFLCFSCVLAYAEHKDMRKENPHEIRVGITEDIFLQSIEMPVGAYGEEVDVNDGYHITGNIEHSYHATGHLFMEYQYRFNHWFGLGAHLDMRGGMWKERKVDYCQWENNSYTINRYTVRMSFMPTVRFTYFNGKTVSLYASLGVGPHFHFKETKLQAIYPAADLCWFGMSMGKKHWFCDMELGITPLPYMVDRLVRLGIGYRF